VRNGRGIAFCAEAVNWCVRQQGNIMQPVVLLDLQGEGHVRQRSLSAVLIFWLLLDQAKSNSSGGDPIAIG